MFIREIHPRLGNLKILGDHRGADWMVKASVLDKRILSQLGSILAFVERSGVIYH